MAQSEPPVRAVPDGWLQPYGGTQLGPETWTIAGPPRTPDSVYAAGWYGRDAIPPNCLREIYSLIPDSKPPLATATGRDFTTRWAFYFAAEVRGRADRLRYDSDLERNSARRARRLELVRSGLMTEAEAAAEATAQAVPVEAEFAAIEAMMRAAPSCQFLRMETSEPARIIKRRLGIPEYP